MSIERRFDVPFVSALSLREKAIQQTYRPVIAVHKWFARRPGALFRALMLSEFVDEDLRTSYFRSHELPDTHVADPFMGGGTPLMEANRMGASVSGWDINPMAWWIVGRKLERIDPNTYAQAATALTEALREQVGDLYETECPECKGTALVKYFFWVKVQPCHRCRRPIDLFPGYLVAARGQHPRHVLVCSKCGDLNETSDRRSPGACSGCREALTIQGPARKGLVSCAHCGAANKFPDPSAGPLGHRMFAIEYHCFACKARRNGRLPARRGRFFKKPSARDLAKYEHAAERWQHMTAEFVPDDSVPPGDESTRLHRWGYRRYRQMFNARQLLGLELSARLVAAQPDRALHRALATNLSDLLRYNNLLVRYDTVSLKALDLFSVHGFPVGLVRCEANLLGIRAPNGRPVGSGGWANIVDKYRTAKEYCAQPFEVAAGSRAKVFMTGEWISEGTQEDGSAHDGVGPKVADLRCGDAAQAQLAPHSLDAVFTDPPYFDSVQYAELMDFATCGLGA